MIKKIFGVIAILLTTLACNQARQEKVQYSQKDKLPIRVEYSLENIHTQSIEFNLDNNKRYYGISLAVMNPSYIAQCDYYKTCSEEIVRQSRELGRLFGRIPVRNPKTDKEEYVRQFNILADISVKKKENGIFKELYTLKNIKGEPHFIRNDSRQIVFTRLDLEPGIYKVDVTNTNVTDQFSNFKVYLEISYYPHTKHS